MRARPRGRLVAPLLVSVALASVALVAAASAAAAGGSFRDDLRKVDGHLRVAIEYAPEELGESLRTAEIVCGLGERAAAHQEADLASADWTTLGQMVDQLATGSARRVEVAFANADSVLADLRGRYEPRWTGAPEDQRALREGVRAIRRGIVVVRHAIAGLDAPFQSWHAHECAAATRGIEAAFVHTPDGLELINVGMLKLIRLGEQPPAANERS